jgi:hypothetical protein
MTIKDICTLTGLSDWTVRDKIKELFPGCCVQGKRTVLTQEQSLMVVEGLRKKGFTTPYDVISHFEQPQHRKDFGVEQSQQAKNWEISLQETLNRQQEELITTFENVQDYYSRFGYCSLRGKEVIK